MALYKGKKQKGDQSKSAYVEDYRTRRSSRIIRAAITVAVLLALFALGFFVIEPLLEKYYHEIQGTQSGETDSVGVDGPNVVDLDGLFSKQD